MQWVEFFINIAIDVSLLGIILLIILVTFYWLLSFRHVSKCIEKIPGIQVIPLRSYLMVINYLQKKRCHDAVVYFDQVLCHICAANKREGITKSWLGLRPYVLLYQQDTVAAVLNSNSIIEKAREYSFLHPWLNTGLLTSAGNKWRSRRRLLTPSFHFRILEGYIPIFNDQSQILVQKIRLVADKEWVDIVPLIMMCALEIICETTMGISLNAEHGKNMDYMKALHSMGDAFIYRGLRPWLWIEWIYYLFPSGRKYRKDVHTLHEFTRKVIREKKAIIVQDMMKNPKAGKENESEDLVGVKKRKAFLEILLEHNLEKQELTEEDIREEVDTFMFEGHDTTTVAMSWALYNIGLRPDVQEKIVKELENIFPDDFYRPVTSDDLKEMTYLECVIKESLRLYPSVPFIGREVTKDFTILNYTIPAGTACMIIPYELHRNPEVFPNPEYFDPDRFSPENSAGRHPYAYVPFSAGPRNCIGQRFAVMEEKIVLTHILRSFEVKSLDQRDKVSALPILTLKNEEPLRLKFTPRMRKGNSAI